jgi:glycosyltransferase involved in cell wall biosynthesis
MNILILESYFTGSHAAWATGYQKFSEHDIEILSLKGQFWKWRMHGGAVTLARLFLDTDIQPDLILATDMLDVTTFLSLTRKRTADIPVALYFHENQFAYPWSPDDRDVSQQRDKHYGFINYASALAADWCFFNSHYNHETFIYALKPFLKHFPDYNEISSIKEIEEKSTVLPLGLDLSRFDGHQVDQQNELPLILWNHRWEHDKNPGDFFRALDALHDAGYDFELALLGENFRNVPREFELAQKKYQHKIKHYGFAESFSEYAEWLWRADILPVTSNHDFFGISVVEAIYCGCLPILPQRLAYPELVPESSYDYFYNGFKELLEKLKISLNNNEEAGQLERFVEKFKWENMAPIYDAELQRLI